MPPFILSRFFIYPSISCSSFPPLTLNTVASIVFYRGHNLVHFVGSRPWYVYLHQYLQVHNKVRKNDRKYTGMRISIIDNRHRILAALTYMTETRNARKCFVRKSEVNRLFRRVGIQRRITLKCVFKVIESKPSLFCLEKNPVMSPYDSEMSFLIL
jgi:hypothetical protein